MTAPSLARLTIPQRRLFAATLLERDVTTLHHGDCINGDADACALAHWLGVPTEAHPSDLNGKRAHTQGNRKVHPVSRPLVRNHHMCDLASLLIALVEGPEASYPRAGTWATVRYAERAGLDIIGCGPDGTLVQDLRKRK